MEPREGQMVTSASIDEPGLKALVGEFLNRWPVAGLAVGVVHHGSLAWFHGHGAADIGAATPVDQDTVFRIGSITKTMTAALILALRDEGRLALDVATFVFTREPWPAR
jgi:CubicO group peptidase (beta-lactamase class C family)